MEKRSVSVCVGFDGYVFDSGDEEDEGCGSEDSKLENSSVGVLSELCLIVGS